MQWLIIKIIYGYLIGIAIAIRYFSFKNKGDEPLIGEKKEEIYQ